MKDDLISRQAAIDVLLISKEILSRVLDETDVVGTDREKYSWGLGLIEASIKDVEELPSAQPEQRWIPVTKEEALQSGYEGREVRFHIGGRLFAIRELAQ